VGVYAGIKDINEAYKVEIIGDILIAFLENEDFDVSPVIHACTVSRLAENLYTDDEILNAEQVIATAQGIERTAFCKLNASLQNGYSLLWDGLMCMHDLRYEEAIQSFKKARNAGVKHWRVDWYVSLSAFKQKKYEQALQNLNVVLAKEPHLEKGLELLKQLNNLM
jgi:tetratricopeptide (TPR) repeat protein